MDETPLLYAAAPGKINLYLKVTGRREDGYHTLESIFLPFAEPADDIAIDLESAPNTIMVGCSDLLVPNGIGNIAGRAAERWAKRAGVVPCWDINIRKNIPVAAGMGGGSSDAGTVLRLLNEHYGTPLTPDGLAEMAVALGADVPYFLDPKPAVMTGIGEKMQALDFEVPEIPLLLLAPEFPVSAAEAYKVLREEDKTPMDETRRAAILSALQNGDWNALAQLLFNDLQRGIFEKYPILSILEKALEEAGALKVLMTGSGPTLFALFENMDKRDEASQFMAARYPEYRTICPKRYIAGK